MSINWIYWVALLFHSAVAASAKHTNIQIRTATGIAQRNLSLWIFRGTRGCSRHFGISAASENKVGQRWGPSWGKACAFVVNNESCTSMCQSVQTGKTHGLSMVKLVRCGLHLVFEVGFWHLWIQLCYFKGGFSALELALSPIRGEGPPVMLVYKLMNCNLP